MRASVRQKILLLSLFPALAALGSNWLMQGAIHDSHSDAAWVAHTLKVLAQANALERAALTSQAALRGFMLTKDDGFARRQRVAAEEFTSLYTSLSELVHDNLAQHGRLSEGHGLFSDWRLDAERVLSGARSPSDLSVVFQGQTTIDRFRQVMHAFSEEEENLLRERQALSDRTNRRLSVISVLATLGALLLGTLISTLYALRLAKTARELSLSAAAMASGKLTTRAKVRGSDELADTARAFNDMASVLSQREEEQVRMKHLREALQLAISMSEAVNAFESLVPGVLRMPNGALFLNEGTRNRIVQSSRFGESDWPEALTSEDCLALRSSKPHWTGIDGALPCPHLKQQLGATLCIPLYSQSEATGLLCLNLPSKPTEAHERILHEVADVLGLAISNLKMREVLRNQAFRDPLTGLYNRRYLDDALKRERSRVQREEKPLCVMMVDVDHFKQLNDQHGHAAGDAVLRDLGAIFLQSFRDTDLPCRYGGEEFAVVLVDISQDTAVQRAEQLRERVKAHAVKTDSGPLKGITVSIGIAWQATNANAEPEFLLRAADAALYLSKRNGRDRVTVAEEPTLTLSAPPLPGPKAPPHKTA